jgi:endoglucanase
VPGGRGAMPKAVRHFRTLASRPTRVWPILGLAVTLVPSCSPNARPPGGEASPTGGAEAIASGTGGQAAGGRSSGGTSTISEAGGSTGVGGFATAVGGTLLATGGSTGGATLTTGGAPSASGGLSGVEVAVDVREMVADLGVGTNIGNTLENTTAWETGWGQPLITRTFVEGLAAHGIKTVRVPVAWDTYAAGGIIDATKAARVKEVVDWIVAAGMYAVVNIHWDGGWIFGEGSSDKYKLSDATKQKFGSYWVQISKVFENTGHQLIFEGLNEEGNFWIDGNSSGTPDYAALNSLNQLFVSTVREQGGFNASRALLIAGFTTDIEKTCVAQFTVPSDPAGPHHIFLSLHYYTPYTFCGLDTVESWGSPATTWGSSAERAELTRLFDVAAECGDARQTPIILGEFGVTKGENFVRDPASRSAWMGAVIEASLTRGIVPVLWDTGSEINRNDAKFSPEFATATSNILSP